MIIVHYMNRRGAGVSRCLRPDEVEPVLSKLRCEARLELDGNVIGGIEEANGGQDDQRVRWSWWYDREALLAASPTNDCPEPRANYMGPEDRQRALDAWDTRTP